MDSWTLQGDSYSFLRSAPRTFSLCHRDGTPNHVEIYDIINVPTQRSAISETTCLCDIFGDDCESSSLSSSPAAGAVVISQRVGDSTVAASPLVDELNDSSGSYHTAQGSSEGEEGFEDSGERVYSPALQSESLEGSLQVKGLSPENSQVFEDSNPNSKSYELQFSSSSPSSQVFNSRDRTPSPGHSSSNTLSPEGRLSPLSFCSAEKRPSSPSPYSNQNISESETGITPSLSDRQNSPSPRPSLSQTEPTSCLNPNSSPLPEIVSYSPNFTDSDIQSRASPSFSPYSTDIESPLGRATFSPELRNPSPLSDPQLSSPFSELRGRVSLPDLFSRGLTPDIKDFAQTPELVSNPSSGRNTSTSPENQERFSAEQHSTVSTPGPRYTPPSPVISVAISPELVGGTVSPDLRNTSASPVLFSTAFPANTRSRSPSPDISTKIRDNLTFSETEESFPVVDDSLSPSPGIRNNSSPIENRFTSPSPEIRITASSPENSSKEQQAETSISPLLEFPSSSVSPRSILSSPHNPETFCSVIQSVERESPVFYQPFEQQTPEPDRIFVPSEAIREDLEGSIHTPQGSSPISGFPRTEATFLHQTPSPQPNSSIPSPEPRHQSPISDKHKTPSPLFRSRDSSPVYSFLEQIHQHSPTSFARGYNSPNTQSDKSARNTPDIETDPEENSKIESPKPITNNTEFSILVSAEKEADSVVQTTSPFEVAHSQSSISSDRSGASSLIQQTKEIEEPITEVDPQDKSRKVSFIEESTNSLSEQKSPSHDLKTLKDRSTNIPAVIGVPSNQTLQTQQIHPQPISYPLTSTNSTFSPASSCTPLNLRRQPLITVRRGNTEKFTEDMSHHAKRRQTPSPPLTRFTPVHIIAPQKPYRQWQNRSRSPSQVLGSSSSGILKKATINRECPSDDLVDNNSQPHWVRLGRQLELEREIPVEQEKDVGMERQREREIDREREREELALEKGEGWQRVTSYRGEQVELSFSARNRKGPVSCSAAPASRGTRQRLPTAHSYSESLVATRQLQQQQNLLRLTSQQDGRGGVANRRPQPPTPQNKRSTTGRVATNRPCQSSSSSMGSELDEADNEVKWFTDVAFRSLSSPEVDYLDMYNSSHRSSTNMSQPSTQESPAGVSVAWPTYADFRGSASKLDHDELCFQQPSVCYSDGLDPSRRYELGSFECIDVALEREDYRKARKGVPKRQIQLKRKSNDEGKPDESSENSSPVLPAMVESSPKDIHPRGNFMRQHSTPAAMHGCFPLESSPEPDKQKERQSKFQKSASMDETCTKTKMASCLIKSVLSKKMQSVDRQSDDQAGEEDIPPTETAMAPATAQAKPDSQNQISSFPSDDNLPSEGSFLKEEAGTKYDHKSSKSQGMRSSNRPSSSSSCRSVTFSQTDSEDGDFLSRSSASLRSEIKSELKIQSDGKCSNSGLQDNKLDRMERSDSANTASPTTSRASSTQAWVENRNQECKNTEDHKQLVQGDLGAYTSTTPEITLKGLEKKKASINVCSTPEAESKYGSISSDISIGEKEGKPETDKDETTEEEQENIKVKAPMHKVRDVRRLVKNTYNLSFKATSAAIPSNEEEERRNIINEQVNHETTVKQEKDTIQETRIKEVGEENVQRIFVERIKEQKEELKEPGMQSLPPLVKSKRNSPLGPQPMQIEYKAVCCKEDKNKMSITKKDEDEKAKASLCSSMEVKKETTSLKSNIQEHTPCDLPTSRLREHDENRTAEIQNTLTENQRPSEKEDKPVVSRTDRKPPMLGSLPKVPSKEREVSTAVVLIRERPNKLNMSISPGESPTVKASDLASHSPGPSTPGSGGHSVSMLLKEKGYQADIGAVVGDNQNTAEGRGVLHKHVNCLEIPLQTSFDSDGASAEFNTKGPSAGDTTDIPTKPREEEGVVTKPPRKEAAKQKGSVHEQTSPGRQKDIGDFEAVKRLDPTFPPRSPAIRRFKPQPIEVKSLSKEAQNQEQQTHSTGNHKAQAIEVKSIAKNSQKPTVPPKPTCKFKTTDTGLLQNEVQRASTASSTGKPQSEERPQTIVVSSPTIYRKISNESGSASNYSRKLAVSTVSSLKPPPHKTVPTTVPSVSNQPALSLDTDAAADGGQRQQPAVSPQSSRHTQKPAPVSTLTSGLGGTSTPEAETNTMPGHRESSETALTDLESQPQHSRVANPNDRAIGGSSNNAVSTTQIPRYTNQRCHRSLSSEHAQRSDELHFYASDDPPSYDERESFSPLLLPDLTHTRQNRYQPSSRHPPCSCAAGCSSHPAHAPPHHHRSPRNLTPPGPPHSPGQALPYPLSQAPLRPLHCRPEPQPMSYQSSSPKSSPLGPNQPPSMYQPLHQPGVCPPHPSLMQACSAERPLQQSQHADPRRPPVHRSPHQQPPGMTGAPYSDPSHCHSPGLQSLDPQYLCGSQNMTHSYGSDYGGDSSSLYSESSYGQTPRRVLLDPETGKYFYIEVPVQPLRKMLFDPETGQYVEVLIPQQAMSHSGLYPPSAAPFPPLHSPNMYASASQYMPCVAPPPLAHPQTQPQPPRYPETSGATIHPSGPGVNYRNASGSGSKPEPRNHPPLDHNYLESMYYVPTGMNASPNPTPPDYYHKHPPNLPPAGGKRS